MKLGIDFKIGDSLWYCYVEFSYSSVRVTRRIFPRKVKIVEHSLGDIWLADDKNDFLKKIDYNISYSYLFKTEEEAKQYWRSSFLNRIDKLRYDYEKDLEYLENYIKREK